MKEETMYIAKRLTVVFRNDAPMVFCEDSPSYRSVTFDLTPEQIKKCGLRYCGTNCGNVIHESVSKCFLEG